MAKDSDISEASGYHLNAMGVFMSILVVSTILFTGATNMGANNKSQKNKVYVVKQNLTLECVILNIFLDDPPPADDI